MAKKITNESGGVPGAAIPDPIAAAAPVPANETGGEPEADGSGPDPEKTTPTQSEQEKQEDQTQSSDATPDYADRLLKIFPAYEQLYIDRLGSTYTADAPPVFRTDATLYTNPYHKD